MVNGIELRFSPPSFETYEQMDSILIQRLSREAYTAKLGFIKAYDTDINLESLKSQLEVLNQILKGEGPMECFYDILCAVKKLPKRQS